jgi:nucleotide-binding universal stress UspA family protein
LSGDEKPKGRFAMFKKLLYPTDFSDVSKKALNYVMQLRDAGAEEVIILHILDQKGIDAFYRYAPASAEEVIGRIEEESVKQVSAIEAELKERGFRVKIRIERGVPLQEILKAEEEEKVSAIVIGSHGKTNLEEMLLGSVSEKVIRKSKSPVFVIRR